MKTIIDILCSDDKTLKGHMLNVLGTYKPAVGSSLLIGVNSSLGNFIGSTNLAKHIRDNLGKRYMVSDDLLNEIKAKLGIQVVASADAAATTRASSDPTHTIRVPVQVVSRGPAGREQGRRNQKLSVRMQVLRFLAGILAKDGDIGSEADVNTLAESIDKTPRIADTRRTDCKEFIDKLRSSPFNNPGVRQVAIYKAMQLLDIQPEGDRLHLTRRFSGDGVFAQALEYANNMSQEPLRVEAVVTQIKKQFTEDTKVNAAEPDRLKTGLREQGGKTFVPFGDHETVTDGSGKVTVSGVLIRCDIALDLALDPEVSDEEAKIAIAIKDIVDNTPPGEVVSLQFDWDGTYQNGLYNEGMVIFNQQASNAQTGHIVNSKLQALTNGIVDYAKSQGKNVRIDLSSTAGICQSFEAESGYSKPNQLEFINKTLGEIFKTTEQNIIVQPSAVGVGDEDNPSGDSASINCFVKHESGEIKLVKILKDDSDNLARILGVSDGVSWDNRDGTLNKSGANDFLQRLNFAAEFLKGQPCGERKTTDDVLIALLTGDVSGRFHRALKQNKKQFIKFCTSAIEKGRKSAVFDNDARYLPKEESRQGASFVPVLVQHSLVVGKENGTEYDGNSEADYREACRAACRDKSEFPTLTGYKAWCREKSINLLNNQVCLHTNETDIKNIVNPGRVAQVLKKSITHQQPNAAAAPPPRVRRRVHFSDEPVDERAGVSALACRTVGVAQGGAGARAARTGAADGAAGIKTIRPGSLLSGRRV